ncbi:hypothetical protein HanRHA438_Chr10g0444321 [Helianthus annuus]|nr:hypothetical protein HanRHA438_Chr10g0444321 [Helianthus annuus]
MKKQWFHTSKQNPNISFLKLLISQKATKTICYYLYIFNFAYPANTPIQANHAIETTTTYF